MPIGWFTFSTASTPAGHKCGLDPRWCKEELERDFAEADAELLELTFAADKPVAKAKVKDLDLNAPKRKALLRKWGGRYQKALTLEEAIESSQYLAELRRRTPHFFPDDEVEGEAEGEATGAL